MSLANNLLYLRKKRQLSQEKLAEDLNVSRQAIGKWESGSDPELAHVKVMCEYFNVNMHTFVCGDVRVSAYTVSNETTISEDSPDTLTMARITQPYKKNNARQYRTIRSMIAAMLFLALLVWRLPDFIGEIGFMVAVGLLIYNRLVKYKLTEDMIYEDSNSEHQQSIWHHTGIDRFFSGNRKRRGIWSNRAKWCGENHTDENSRNFGTPDNRNDFT